MKTMKYQGQEVKIKSNTIGVTIPELKAALKATEEYAGYREKEIINNLDYIEISSHVYPGDCYWRADAYNTEKEGFQFIIKHETDRGNGFKPGDIVG